MNTHFTLAGIQLQLKRWPTDTDFVNLQAWDAVDELLLSAALERLASNQLSVSQPVLVLNDQFGALSCLLLARYPKLQLVHVSDSLVSQQACKANLQLNQLPTQQVQWLDSLAPLPDSFALVLMRIPRDHGYLAYQLNLLSAKLQHGNQLLVAARARDIHKNLLLLFHNTLGPTSASLTLRKCRYLQTSLATPRPAAQSDWPKSWPLEQTRLTLVNHANVFSGERLDIGARFFLQHLPTTEPEQQLVDLGCGNGVLGLSALVANPALQVLFSDESAMAVASAKLSVAQSLPALLEQCTFSQDDGLSQLADQSVDWVLCNPPFHQQDTITSHLARQMFHDAWRVLKPGGRLRIVANRHLPYGQQLSALFGGVRCLASQKKFIILESERRK